MDIHKQYDEMMDDIQRVKELRGASQPVFNWIRLKKRYDELYENKMGVYISKDEIPRY